MHSDKVTPPEVPRGRKPMRLQQMYIICGLTQGQIFQTISPFPVGSTSSNFASKISRTGTSAAVRRVPCVLSIPQVRGQAEHPLSSGELLYVLMASVHSALRVRVRVQQNGQPQMFFPRCSSNSCGHVHFVRINVCLVVCWDHRFPVRVWVIHSSAQVVLCRHQAQNIARMTIYG